MSIDPSDWIKPVPANFSATSGSIELATGLYTTLKDDWNGLAAAPVRTVFDTFAAKPAFRDIRPFDQNEPTQFLRFEVKDGNMDAFLAAVRVVPGVVSAGPAQFGRLQ